MKLYMVIIYAVENKARSSCHMGAGVSSSQAGAAANSPTEGTLGHQAGLGKGRGVLVLRVCWKTCLLFGKHSYEPAKATGVSFWGQELCS